MGTLRQTLFGRARFCLHISFFELADHQFQGYTAYTIYKYILPSRYSKLNLLLAHICLNINSNQGIPHASTNVIPTALYEEVSILGLRFSMEDSSALQRALIVDSEEQSQTFEYIQPATVFQGFTYHVL